jgi:amino acid permease
MYANIYAHSGGAIGAGLFVGSGNAFQTGGPASVLLGFIIIGTFYNISFATCDNL